MSHEAVWCQPFTARQLLLAGHAYPAEQSDGRGWLVLVVTAVHPSRVGDRIADAVLVSANLTEAAARELCARRNEARWS
jgi:hypothetical protein